MALTEQRRREFENLRSRMVSIERQLYTALGEAESTLPKGAVPGMLSKAAALVQDARHRLEDVAEEEAGD